MSSSYSIDSIYDSENHGFTIKLSQVNDPEKKIKIFFKDWVWSYKYVQEIFAINRLHLVSNKYDDTFFRGNTFFRIENSEYIKILSKESAEAIDYYGRALHFCFISSESVLDVVSHYEPVVELLK